MRSRDQWVAVFTGDLARVTLLMTFLAGDELQVKIVPDVTSPPLQDPAAHGTKSQYTRHLLLARASEEALARELIEAYLKEEEV